MTLIPLLLAGAALGSDGTRAPSFHAVLNPATGLTETVWAPSPPEAPHQVLHSILSAGGWSAPAPVNGAPLAAPARDPRLSISPSGDRLVVWWQEGGGSEHDTVWQSAQPAAGGAWTSPERVEDGAEDIREPESIFSNGVFFVACQTGVPGARRRVQVRTKQEGPDPWPVCFDHPALFTGDLELQIHSENGHVWVDWVDTDVTLRWAELHGCAWDPPRSEPIDRPGGVAGARLRVREFVLGR